MSIKNWKDFLKDVPSEVLKSELEDRENKNSSNLNELSIDIMEKIDNAIQQFGVYNFEDKGPWEVMNIKSIKSQLEKLSIKEIANILKEVLDNYKNYNHASRLVNTIIGEFDDLEDNDFEELLDSDERFEY